MERLRVLGCDHLGLARGKYLGMEKLQAGSTRLCRGVYGVTYRRDLLPSPGSKMLEGLPDMEAVWDEEDVRESWVEGEKILLTDYYGTDGEPLPMCGRGALRRAISAWEERGLKPKVGIELEAYGFVENGEGILEPISTPGSFVYSTGPHADPYGFTDTIWEIAREMGLPLEMITTEYDASQFEFALVYDDALKAVDDAFLFKQMAREIALERGIILTFMAKPVGDRGGSGIHVNYSFEDEGGRNVMREGEGCGVENLSEVSRGCVSGLMYHHKSLAGVCAPTVNSYERLQPGSLSGYWQNWGGDHRSVTVRVPSEGGKKSRIEHRMADAGANLYTMTASILYASLLGLEKGYGLSLPEGGDGFENVGTKVSVGSSLGEALDDLEGDKVLIDRLGETLVANHVFIKRAEIEEVGSLEGEDAKRDYYIHFI